MSPFSLALPCLSWLTSCKELPQHQSPQHPPPPALGSSQQLLHSHHVPLLTHHHLLIDLDNLVSRQDLQLEVRGDLLSKG